MCLCARAHVCMYFFNPHPKTCLLILEGKGGREGGEKHRCERETPIGRCLSCMHPNRDQIGNLSMCADWELNLEHFGLCDDAPTN